MSAPAAAVTPDDIERAAQTIAGLVHETPVLRADPLAEIARTPVFFKAENLQVTGSFKLRGATNAIASLSQDARAGGVVAASAGNHAQAVALAATRAGVRATLCMPADAPLTKIHAVRAYGGEVQLVEGSYDDAQEAARAIADDEGRPLVHAFADPAVVAGQGTIAGEILGAVPEARSIVVPLGGGGLVSGIAIAAKAASPDIRIVGVQAEARTGRTIADGIAVKRPAELTLGLIEEHVDEVVTVSDDEIARTMVHLVERAKLVVEGAGAAAAAAVEHERVDVTRDGPCCVVLSGGNLDASLLAECIRMGETAAGRRYVLKTVVPDRPGALAGLLRAVAEQGANVIDVAHLREGVDLHVRETLVRLVIQTKGPDHAAEVTERIQAEGFSVDVER